MTMLAEKTSPDIIKLLKPVIERLEKIRASSIGMTAKDDWALCGARNQLCSITETLEHDLAVAKTKRRSRVSGPGR